VNDHTVSAARAQRPAYIPDHVPQDLVFDIEPYTDPNNAPDPFASTKNIYQELPPLVWMPYRMSRMLAGYWVVTHYEDIREVYQNDALYSTADAANFQTLIGETWRMIPLAVDPPEHGKYRLLLNPWFSPKAITEMEGRIRGTINELIDGFIDKGECDVAYDYGRIYPVRVFLDLMGFPREMMDEFLSWEYALLHSFGDVEKVKWGIGSAIKYLRGFIEEVRAKPQNNLASHIVHGKVDGRPLTEDEIIGTITFLWVGGLDTVAATTSLMFRRLALQPELQQMLRDKPALIPDAIEEFLRVQPLVNSNRLVKEDHEIRGQLIKKGEQIQCFNAAGNFDAAEFSDPRDVRFDRPSNRHFTLAGGPHRCLGSHLARRELRIALEEFLRRVPTFRIKPDVEIKAMPGLLAVPRLPLVWS
jgi:cytochrome P450